jgi:hypothetical protein
LAASLSAGWLAQRHSALAILLAVGLPLTLVLARIGIVAVSAIVLVLTLNGLPGLDLSQFHVPGAFNPADAGGAALIAIGAARLVFGKPAPLGRAGGWLALWASLFLVVWGIAWYRGVARGVPLTQAASFGQDFLIFGLLLPLAPSLVKTRAEAWRFIAVVGLATVVYALGDIAASLKVISPGLINAQQTASSGPITRVYTTMADLITFTFALALALALVAHGRKMLLAICGAAVTGVAIVLALTRAEYFGLVAGLFGAVLIAVTRVSPSVASQLRSRSFRVLAGGVVVGLLTALFFPQLFHGGSVQAVITRATSGLSAVTGGSQPTGANTFVYRQGVDHALLAVLGGRWPIGLGFLHPNTIYLVNAPSGTIRNADTGVLNSMMTMGLVGTILLYVPLGYVAVVTCRSWRFQRGDAPNGLRLGVLIWLIATLVASITLITLFSITGLTMTAVMLGVVLRLVTGGGEERAGAPL